MNRHTSSYVILSYFYQYHSKQIFERLYLEIQNLHQQMVQHKFLFVLGNKAISDLVCDIYHQHRKMENVLNCCYLTSVIKRNSLWSLKSVFPELKNLCLCSYLVVFPFEFKISSICSNEILFFDELLFEL